MSIGLPLTLGGVGINDNLPAQVSYLNLTNQVVDGKAQVEITWGNPASNFGGVAIVRKEGSAPSHFTDGVRVYDGTGASCLDPDVEVGKTYFYRAFPYNGRRQVQTLGAVPSIVPTVGKRLAELPVGSFVKLKENGVGALFYVAKHDYEAGLNGPGRTLLVRKDCPGEVVWSSSDSRPYESNGVDKICSSHINRFATTIRAAVGVTKFYASPGKGDVITLSRAGFALSVTELGTTDKEANTEGTTLPIAGALRIAYLNGSPCHQWTRSSCQSSSAGAFMVRANGETFAATPRASAGYRPAFTLPADFLLKPTANSDSSYSPINE